MTAGLKGERDRFAGIDLRTVTDASLEEKWVTSDRLTLSTLSGVTWTRERPIGGIVHNDLGALLSAHGELDFSSASALTLELTYFPDFTRTRAYRLEGKAAVQAAMSSTLPFAWEPATNSTTTRHRASGPPTRPPRHRS